MSNITNLSYQSLFEESHFYLSDPITLEHKSAQPTTLRQIIDKCGYTAEEVARCLFDNVMVTGTSSVSQVGYSFVCVASIHEKACLFLGHATGDRLGHVFSLISVSFDFPKSDGIEHIRVLVRTGGRVVALSGVGLYNPWSQFALFLRAVNEQKGLDVWFPNVNHEIGRLYFPVGYFTRRKISRLLKRWEAEAGEKPKPSRLSEWLRVRALRSASAKVSTTVQAGERTVADSFETTADLRDFFQRITGYIDQGFGSSKINRIIRLVDKQPDIAEPARIEFPIVHAGVGGRFIIQVWLSGQSPFATFWGPEELIEKIEKDLGLSFPEDEE